MRTTQRVPTSYFQQTLMKPHPTNLGGLEILNYMPIHVQWDALYVVEQTPWLIARFGRRY